MPQNMRICATDLGSHGNLQVNVVSIINNFPINDATVRISYKGEPSQTVEEVTTNSSGQTEQVSLSAPDLQYSLNPGNVQPYSEYNLEISAPGFKTQYISGTEILPDSTAIQPVALEPEEDTAPEENPILIPDHTLYGHYPPKIAESEIKPTNESGEIVLSRVVVPQTIVVHDGVPTDSSAPNYYVPYRDYIKNVASSEIYATWPQSTITANVLAIMSFTLNRVYTEWYRNQGYDFTITSSTAFDHKWIYGRNIFESISLVVDEIFDNYLSRPDVKQPILTQYCDGRQVTCPNWMTKLQVRIRLNYVKNFLLPFLSYTFHQTSHAFLIHLRHLIFFFCPLLRDKLSVIEFQDEYLAGLPDQLHSSNRFIPYYFCLFHIIFLLCYALYYNI